MKSIESTGNGGLFGCPFVVVTNSVGYFAEIPYAAWRQNACGLFDIVGYHKLGIETGFGLFVEDADKLAIKQVDSMVVELGCHGGKYGQLFRVSTEQHTVSGKLFAHIT